MRFRHFARRRLRRLGLVAIALAVATPATTLAHEDDHGPGDQLEADLSVALNGSPNPVQGGDMATFTLTVTNSGPDSARRLRAAIVLTGPRAITRAEGFGWSCEIDDAMAECTRRRLQAGFSSPITFVAMAPRGFGRIGAGAAVTSRTDDPRKANNSTGLQIDVNNPPIANADTAATTAGVKVGIPVLTNDADPDGDQLSLSGPSAADMGGTVQCGDSTSDEEDLCLYTPASGFIGTETFSYTVSDGRGASASAVVTVTVSPVPPLPGPDPDPNPDPPGPKTDPPGNSGPGVSLGGAPTVTEGQTAPYTVTIVNTCSVIAEKVLLRLSLPAGTTVVSAPSRSVLKGRVLMVPIGTVRSTKPRHVGVRLRFRANGGNLRTLIASVTSANGRLAGDGIVIAVRPR